METDFSEDLSKLSKTEIMERTEKLTRDKKYVSYKTIYWNELYKQVRDYEYRLTKRAKELKGLCEICGFKREEDDKDVLRSLPDGRQVCKKCWNTVVDDILIRNRRDRISSATLIGL